MRFTGLTAQGFLEFEDFSTSQGAGVDPGNSANTFNMS